MTYSFINMSHNLARPLDALPNERGAGGWSSAFGQDSERGERRSFLIKNAVMQANRRTKTRGSTLAAFALAAVAAAAVAYAVSRRQSKQKQQELEEESKASEKSETAAESPATPTRRASRPSHDNPEAQTPEWLRTACTALARHAVPSPARAAQGLSDRLNGARDPPEGASSGGNHPVQHSIREEESEEADPVEEGAQQQVRLPTGVALTAALFGVVVAWAWNGTLWSDLAYGRLGWLYGFLVCE